MGPSIDVTKPTSTPDGAEADADSFAKKYQQDQWPGGMASVVALVLWTDTGTWSGVVNSYYSSS